MARATLYRYDLDVFNFTYISAILACSIYKQKKHQRTLDTIDNNRGVVNENV